MRSGLISDVEVFEDHPASYLADVSRHHRWTRGDWQIASWLLPWVPVGDGRLQRNPLSALSLWKIADNLRRSLVPVALLLLLLAGWLTSLAAALDLVVVGVLVSPAFLGILQQLFRKPPDSVLRLHVAMTLRSAVVRFIHALLALVCLPHDAFVNTDAVLRTTWRMLVSHRRRLAWSPYGAPSQSLAPSLLASFRSMWVAPAVATATLRAGRFEAGRTGVGGTGAPAVVVVAGHHVVAEQAAGAARAASEAEPGSLSPRLARRTWAYFETFVGPEDNWLPPTTSRSCRYRASRIAHRRPTWASRCSPT